MPTLRPLRTAGSAPQPVPDAKPMIQTLAIWRIFVTGECSPAPACRLCVALCDDGSRDALVPMAAAIGAFGICLVGAASAWRIRQELSEQNLRLDVALNNMTQGLCMFDCTAPAGRLERALPRRCTTSSRSDLARLRDPRPARRAHRGRHVSARSWTHTTPTCARRSSRQGLHVLTSS